MKKDLTNSRLDRQNILNNEMAIEEIQNKSGVEGIVSIEGCTNVCRLYLKRTKIEQGSS